MLRSCGPNQPSGGLFGAGEDFLQFRFGHRPDRNADDVAADGGRETDQFIEIGADPGENQLHARRPVGQILDQFGDVAAEGGAGRPVIFVEDDDDPGADDLLQQAGEFARIDGGGAEQAGKALVMLGFVRGRRSAAVVK